MASVNTSCFTADQPSSPFVLTGICFVSFLISLPGFILGLHQYCVKNKLSILRTERLLLYLSLVAFIFSFLGSFQWVAHFARQEYRVAETACVALGYSWFLVGILFLLITLSIGVHFALQICRPKCLKVTSDELARRSKRMEVSYFVVSLVLAIACSPWPFFKNVFGYNQWICWILTIKKLDDDDTCVVVSAGVLVTTTFYCAVLVIVVFSFVVMVIIHFLVCASSRMFPYVWAFSLYLLVTLVVMCTTMIVNFLSPEYVPPWVHTIKILSLGAMPLIASLVTTIAIVYKLLFSGTPEYRSLHSVKLSRYDGNTQRASSSTESTHWIPPPTSILEEGKNEDSILIQ